MRRSLSTTTTVSMDLDLENEERFLAPKSDISHKPSTSVVQKEKEMQERVLSKRKKIEEREVMNKKTSVFLNTSRLIVSSSQVSTEAKDVERLHWEPPLRQAAHRD